MLNPSAGADGSVDAHSPCVVSPSPLPTASFFYEPLIDALGELTDYRSDEGVPMGDVIKPTLLKAGIDPETHPHVVSGHWPLRGTGNGNLRRVITWAFRNQRERYCGQKTPLTVMVDWGIWGLTEAGVEAAMERRLEEESAWRGPEWSRNRTEEWVGDHGKITSLLSAVADAFGVEIDASEEIKSMVEQNALGDILREVEDGTAEEPGIIDLLIMINGPLPEAPSLPSPTKMYDDVVVTLCETLGYNVDGSVSTSPELYNAVLRRHFGIEPSEHPLVTTGLWPLKGKPSLYRSVQFAMRAQTDTLKSQCVECGKPVSLTVIQSNQRHCGHCKAKIPLAYPGSRLFTTFHKTPGKRDRWGLTSKGIAFAVVRQSQALGVDVTSFWLSRRDEALEPLGELITKRFARISQGRAHDLQKMFLDKLRSEDTYRQRIQAGDLPLDEEIIQQCYQFVDEQFHRSNGTADWFNVDTESKMQIIRERMAATLTKSREMGEIDDLLHEFIVNIIRRDGITTYMERNPGRNVTPRMVANWAINASYSYFRDASKDCHGREFRNALSKRERRARAALKDPRREDEWEEARETLHHQTAKHTAGTSCTPVHLTANSEGRDTHRAGSVYGTSAPLMDVMADHVDQEERILHEMDRQRGLSMIEQAIRNHKPGAPDRYVDIFRYVAGVDQDEDGRYEGDPNKDLNCREIAAIEGVKRNRAASLTQDMRAAMRASLADTQQAIHVLNYIEELPGAKECDIHEDLGLDYSDIVKMSLRLIEDGYLEAEQINDTESCYTLTKRGQAVVREHNNPGLSGGLYHRLLI